MGRDEGENRPQPILPRLQGLEPERDVVFTAIKVLRDSSEIRQFVGEYVDFRIGTYNADKKAKTKRTLMGNIGFILGQYDSDISQRWFDAVEDLSHPIFGRTIPADDPVEAQAKIAVHDLLRDIQKDDE